MSDEHNEKERRFIREKIVPRKKYKKVIGLVLAMIGITILFGAAVGMALSIGDRFLSHDVVSKIETIVIARDEVNETEQKTAGGNEEASQKTNSEERQTAETYVKEAELDTTPEETTAAPEEPTIGDIVSATAGGIVYVTYTRSTESDYLDSVLIEKLENFGAIVYQTDESYYILTDKPEGFMSEGTCILVNGKEATLSGVDEPTGLMVVSIAKESIPGAKVIPLGNSFLLEQAEEVYLLGAPQKLPGGVDVGIITYAERSRDIVDGYEQNLYTNMLRAAGGSGVLVNRDARIVGWVSDRTNAEGSLIAVANGISPIKYLIEDLCQGRDTAYLGILGTRIGTGEAETLGIPEGYYVQEVVENSPAYLSGIQVGDCITSIGESRITDSRSLMLGLDSCQSGQEVTAEIMRRTAEGFETCLIPVTLGNR